MNNKAILFFGMSGSGKGTQANLLDEFFKKNDPERGVLRVETGKGFRTLAKEDGNFTGQIVKRDLDEGGLMPEFLPIWIWTDMLVKNYTGQEHIIMDGLARRVTEAPVLESALRYYNLDTVVFYLKTSKEWSAKRLLERGRYDDNEQDIDVRLTWFEKNVTPSIEYFKKVGGNVRFVEIDGERAIEDVHDDIIRAIK